MRKISLLILLVIFVVAPVVAQTLLPVPQSYSKNSSNLQIQSIKIVSDILEKEIAEIIEENGASVSDDAKATFEIKIVDAIAEAKTCEDEAYRLTVSKNGVVVEATTKAGAYWALQTFRQLTTDKQPKTGTTYAGCEIVDWPAFSLRGFMFDVGRTYMSLEDTKTAIKMLSRYKINTFHWHLTENQSWRMESKIFPMINDSINTTRMSGQYYTIEEAKELVQFCKDHNVLLIPEFDMPGHSAAFVRTFRHDMQSKEGMAILKLLVDEVCEVFDVPYLHIGTDEVHIVNPDFVPEMIAFVRERGKKVISWMPGSNYKVGEIDMQHLWSYKGKATPGIAAIDSKLHYLNHFDTFGDIVALYTSRVYDQNQGSDDVKGVILAIWNDRWLDGDYNILIENNFYPNMMAIAERSWQGGGLQYFTDFGTMLESTGSSQYKMFADFEQRMLIHKAKYFETLPFGYVKQTHAKWMITDQIPNGGDLAKSFEPEQELKTSYEIDGVEYATKEAIGSGIYLRHVWGEGTIPGFYEKPLENHTAYAYTYVYSPKAQDVGMWIEFQNFSRSEMDLPPAQGKWDEKGSRIWLNDSEIMPPYWTATHTERTNEEFLGNENFLAREPIMVTLNRGWNKVFLKLPVGKFHIANPRLTKWMFAVAFVTPDGKDGIDGLKYSTTIR